MRSMRSPCLVLITASILASGGSVRAEHDEVLVVGNPLVGHPADVHGLVIDETNGAFGAGLLDETVLRAQPAGVAIQPVRLAAAGPGPRTGLYTSRVITADFPFNEIVPSWNVEVPEGAGFVVEIRLGLTGGKDWTPFYYFGTWGDAPAPERKILKDEHAEVKGDCLLSSRLFDRMQYRVHLSTTDAGHAPVLRRFGIAFSNTRDDAGLARRMRKAIDPGPKEKWARRLPVPFRSQKWESIELRGRCCSPTSVSMVMEYYGVSRPTAAVAGVVWDPEYEMYGTWNRAVQGAFAFGLPGYIERFNDWNAVKRHIAAGRPVIISIIVEPYDFKGASPYRSSDGHLIVLAGFDADGNVHVNDPAGSTPKRGCAIYPKEGVEAAWFGHGGVGYVLMPAEDSAATRSTSNR